MTSQYRWGGGPRFCDDRAQTLVVKSMARGSKNIKNCVTSLMDDSFTFATTKKENLDFEKVVT